MPCNKSYSTFMKFIGFSLNFIVILEAFYSVFGAVESCWLTQKGVSGIQYPDGNRVNKISEKPLYSLKNDLEVKSRVRGRVQTFSQQILKIKLFHQKVTYGAETHILSEERTNHSVLFVEHRKTDGVSAGSSMGDSINISEKLHYPRGSS